MTPLIEISYLTEKCMLSDKVDARKYKSALEDAQLALRSALGAEFYDQIETQYPSSLSADNLYLYDNYIKGYLAWETYLEYLPLAQIDSTGTGIRSHDDANSSLANDFQFHSVTKAVRMKAENYKGRMISYLKLEQEKDSAKYPLYKGCSPDTFAFGISSISGGNSEVISIHKAIVTNE